MIIGFTGTRTGITHQQRRVIKTMLEEHAPNEFHHGDCVGADADAHAVVRVVVPGCKIIVHPPRGDSLRADCAGDFVLPPLPYLARNGEIVKACDLLIACPEGPERKRSGTWSTVRLARKLGKPLVIIYPDGRVER